MRLRTALLGATALALAGAAHAQETGQRGRSGQLNILYWQAPSTLNPYLSGGTKDVDSASLILEPLARYDEDGVMVPWLAEAIPSVEAGSIAEDLTSITWTLREGLVWSDGTAVTAEDVVFTWTYCTDPEGGCAQARYFEGVQSVEAVDDRTVRITFTGPTPFPYTAFVGSESPIIQKAQFQDCLGARAPECTSANFGPIGTGPFVVADFRPNDVIQYIANETFREAGKPAFATVTLKGGGDAAAAALAVLDTGEIDYAWNLQIDPSVLAEMETRGKGEVITAFGTSVERLHLNQTNADPSLPPDQRSVYMDGENPHPIFQDPAVGRALSKAIDRELLVDIGYGAGGRATCNVLPAPEPYASTANDDCLVQDIEAAKAILDEAGWVPGRDGVRVKDGVRLDLTYQTSTNAIRQDTQALISQWWDELGVETELRDVGAAVFFGGDPDSPDTFQKFYADVEMYAENFAGADPGAYLANWRCEAMPGPSTGWQGENVQRYCDPAYDALVTEMAQTTDPDARADLARRMNDMLVRSYSIIPLIHRGSLSARSNALGGVRMNDWDSELWNIKDWYRIGG